MGTILHCQLKGAPLLSTGAINMPAVILVFRTCIAINILSYSLAQSVSQINFGSIPTADDEFVLIQYGNI